jgi:threonine dehydrogenase-like Zn-dependent dehydrogenase
METGRILGHENLGEVVEAGAGVDRVRAGDMVCLPFNISCGHCANCEHGLTAFCLETNPDPDMVGAAYGFAGMGPYDGGQAELLRVPFADFNCLVLPENARDRDRQRDYVMLADIFPTGWHATQLARVQPGDSVVIYGAGPVGQMAALSATIKNAAKIMVVDHRQDRLELAAKIGAMPIDASKESVVDRVMEETAGRGADRGCECVGYQAHDPSGREHPEMTLNRLVQTVKSAGTIGVVGVYPPEDPGSPDQLFQQGKVAFDFGAFWTRGQTMGTGQCNVKAYNRPLLNLIEQDKARPSYVVSHELPLRRAPEGYEHFDKRERGWTKVIMHPDL